MNRINLSAIRGLRRPQGGFALIEAIAALVLLVVGMTAILATVFSLLGLARVHRDRVRSGVESIDIAESIDRASYVECASLSQMRSALSFPTTVDGFTFDVSTVQYLESQTAASASWVDNAATCQSATDQGLQRIEVAVTRPNGKGVEKLWFVARDDTCKGTITTLAGQKC